MENSFSNYAGSGLCSPCQTLFRKESSNVRHCYNKDDQLSPLWCLDLVCMYLFLPHWPLWYSKNDQLSPLWCLHLACMVRFLPHWPLWCYRRAALLLLFQGQYGVYKEGIAAQMSPLQNCKWQCPYINTVSLLAAGDAVNNAKQFLMICPFCSISTLSVPIFSCGLYSGV